MTEKFRPLDTGYLCPVCGLILDFKAWDSGYGSQEICPCCGTQFGYSDSGNIKEEIISRWNKLRKEWIDGGMKWNWSMKWHRQRENPDSEPQNWNPIEQLKTIPEEFLEK